MSYPLYARWNMGLPNPCKGVGSVGSTAKIVSVIKTKNYYMAPFYGLQTTIPPKHFITSALIEMYFAKYFLT